MRSGGEGEKKCLPYVSDMVVNKIYSLPVLDNGSQLASFNLKPNILTCRGELK